MEVKSLHLGLKTLCVHVVVGLDPLSDCPDAATWYSFGTYAASLIGGLKMGAAKNVTLYSGTGSAVHLAGKLTAHS